MRIRRPTRVTTYATAKDSPRHGSIKFRDSNSAQCLTFSESPLSASIAWISLCFNWENRMNAERGKSGVRFLHHPKPSEKVCSKYLFVSLLPDRNRLGAPGAFLYFRWAFLGLVVADADAGTVVSSSSFSSTSSIGGPFCSSSTSSSPTAPFVVVDDSSKEKESTGVSSEQYGVPQDDWDETSDQFIHSKKYCTAADTQTRKDHLSPSRESMMIIYYMVYGITTAIKVVVWAVPMYRDRICGPIQQYHNKCTTV